MPTSSTAATAVQKHFSTSILLWVRNEQTRQTGMDYWKGPHSGIAAERDGGQLSALLAPVASAGTPTTSRPR
ncbi:hypothetical protein [Pseudoclavibacter terrae]|uniref:hypothetical protein n=1 Tax=Pseudoclavibacter terrae TaxID=1530195 RepID=UPI00232F9909|nr:hypothetical protein [Pseudoclavibacter terrae]